MIPTATKKSASSTKATPASASVTKSKVKKVKANHGPTTSGSLKVQQMMQGTFVVPSDTSCHSAVLPLPGVYHTCAPCYLVGIERKFTPITYTQRHGIKCSNYPIFYGLARQTS